MKLEELVDTVEKMIVEHDYPGFEPRALKLGLPAQAVDAPLKVFGEALGYDNVFVRLASLRWFQTRPGLAKSYATEISALVENVDPWVRAEALKTLERASISDRDTLRKVAAKLKDSDEMVRTAAAKACGKLFPKTKEVDPDLLAALRLAASDPDEKVRWKAQKALRRLGAYEGSST